MSVVIETTLGDLTVDLYLSKRPRACLNFLKLCKMKYYNYNLFHTISHGFIAQTGDPTGSRTGGESLYGILDGPERRYFEAENEPRIKHTKMGLISFVGNEERMIGSQFFITLGEDLTYLDQKHCVFGEVVEGLDILADINEVICDTSDRPYQDVRITHTVILEDPYPDPKRFLVPSRSPSPSAERLQGGRIAPDEDIDETEGKSAQEVAELQADREAKARATILEMVGDLPDAEMAPPENVLFVCKLNPVTSDDDLEIIFNRFGKIVSCEVIRDRKTGDSLQYAFIEFGDRKSCEDAYFKMDNILIDDRRIHVDFSQSVSKVRWLGKGRGVAHFDEKGRKTTNVNNDIGKGNYKVKRRDRSSSPPNNNHNKSQRDRDHSHKENNERRDKSNSNSQSTRNREHKDEYRSHRDSNKENGSRRNRDKFESERKSSTRHREDNYRSERKTSSRRRSRSRSRSLTRRMDDKRNNRSRDVFERRREGSSRRSDNRNRRRSRSRSAHRNSNRDRNYSRPSKNGSFTSKTYERDSKAASHKNDESTKREIDHKRKSSKSVEPTKPVDKRNSKKIKSKSDSESSESESEKDEPKKSKRQRNESSSKERDSESKDEKSKNKQKHSESKTEKIKKKTKTKRKRKESTETDSDSSSSESDSSDSEDEKSKRRKQKKKTTKKSKKRSKRKYSTDSDSSDTSDSSESESSTESEEEEKKKKKKKHKKRTKYSSDSDSSESDTSKSKKKKKRKH